MLVTLTELDSDSDMLALVPCFVFALPPSLDEDGRSALVEWLKGAAERVVEKWRMLSGTPERTKDGLWAIRLPDVDEQHPTRTTVGFSTAAYAQPYHLAAGLPSPLPPLSSSRSGVFPLTKRSFFRPSTLPQSLAGHMKHNHPLVHVHASLFPDTLAVGVSVPHGLLDGHGVGMLLQALRAELHGEEWGVPPLWEEGENPFTAALDRLKADETIAAQADGEPHLSVAASWRPFSVLGLLAFLVSVLVEVFGWKSEPRRVFLRQDLIDRLVQPVKEEVKRETGGKEFVSTGDVLVAWLLRTTQASDTNSGDNVIASAIYSPRFLLDSHSPSSSSPLSLYPSACVFNYQLLPVPIPLSTLISTSFAALSLTFRRNLERYRSLPAIRSALFHPGSQTSPSLVPIRDSPQLPPFLRRLVPWRKKAPHTHRFFFTNQCSLGMADLSLPHPTEEGEDLPLVQYCLDVDMPIVPDHMVSIQKVDGGFTMSASMRRSRWDALKRAIEELEKARDEVL
ncbi:hypothetical protein JCM8547_006004 [Rhodosporidiobolus lusitaniae]